METPKLKFALNDCIVYCAELLGLCLWCWVGLSAGLAQSPSALPAQAADSSPTEGSSPAAVQGEVVEAITSAMKRASRTFREQVATHGGYVYYYDLSLQTRWGEGLATPDQIWVQPPATPTVGLAYVAAFEATQDPHYLDAVREVAEALIYGQLRSGGWTNCIDFASDGGRVQQYLRSPGRPRGKNYSSLDDGQTQAALQFLIHADRLFGFRDQQLHAATELGLRALLAAQFPNGGFPQVWAGPVSALSVSIADGQAPRAASFPEYDWRTEGRVKEYWNLYTLNDDLAPWTAEALWTAYQVYGDEEYRRAYLQLGQFLKLAQLPEPQPAWAQQYTYALQPAWARSFEPPAIAGRESLGIIALLLDMAANTGEAWLLEPIPAALDYLQRSELSEGQIARYYELQTNRPLYMQRQGSQYVLTYDDSQLPEHYGWKAPSNVRQLRDRWQQVQSNLQSNLQLPAATITPAATEAAQALSQAMDLVDQLDSQGRWVSTYRPGERLVGQPKFKAGASFLSSEQFSRNLSTLAAALKSLTAP